MRTNLDESPLIGRLRHRIQREGPLTFADFMAVALYDPEDGFYARSPIGREGHFVTSPHVSPAFGALVARQLAECWENLDRPEPFTVVELGAGDGTLARTILESVRAVPELDSALRYIGIERTPGQIDALRAAGIETAGSLKATAPVIGCIIANEVLDNVPFHRIRERDGRIVEVLVGVDGDHLVEVEGDPTRGALAAISRPPEPDEERAASPQALAVVREIAASLELGYAFLFDYGFRAGERPGPVHSYRGHEVLADVLEDPGSRDITAGVDVDAVAQEARGAGLDVWEPVTQRDALLALGYRLWSEGVRKRQTETLQHDPVAATRLFEERSRASILVDQGKLGGLYLLALGTKGLPAPAAITPWPTESRR